MPPPATGEPLGLRILSQLRFAHALNSLASLHPQVARRLRSLHVSGFLLCISGIASVVIVTQLGAADVADVVALRVLSYACWLYGGFGLWALLAPGAMQTTALGPLRGLDLPVTLPMFARLSTTLLLGIGLSGLLPLAWVVLASGEESVWIRSTQLLLAVVYVAALAFTLALVGAACLALSKRRARSLSLLLLVVPACVDLFLVPTPHLIGFFVSRMSDLIARGVT